MLDNLPHFLESDWRQQPRLFKNAVRIADLVMDQATLSNFATDDLVESRLINAEGDVIHGPFEHSGDDNTLLPPGYMLMLHSLEQQHEAVADMLVHSFGFLPRWQVDDVMASFGGDGSSCGAHFDRYDVFLVQVSGSKTWQLDQEQHVEADLCPDTDARLLERFSPSQTLTAEPGDVLYIPPGVGHHGICVGDSLTLSVGIRNPTMAEVLSDVASEMLAAELQEQLDAPIEQSLHPSTALPVSAAVSLKSSLEQLFDQRTLLNWYGCFVTRLRNPDMVEPLANTPSATLGVALPSRVAWFELDNHLHWFINGEAFELPMSDRDFVVTLTEKRQAIRTESLSPMMNDILEEQVETGALYFVS